MDHRSRRDFLKKLGLGAAAMSAADSLLAQALAPGPQPATKPLGYAVVGIGNLAKGQVLPALMKTKLSRLTGLISGSIDEVRHIARHYGVAEKNIYTYQDYDHLASSPDIDVVYIALPNAMHAE